MLQTIAAQQFNHSFVPDTQQQAITSLESGKVLYFPELAFALHPEEKYFLSPGHADPRSKNIGYHPGQNKLWGVQRLTDEQRLQLKAMLDRFSRHAHQLIKGLLPQYIPELATARTSYRPVQVSNRKTSYRKDDKRLHVDAFPSSPNQGKRILRVFSNVNPNGESRIWRLGEPFEQVANRFAPQIPKPLPGLAHVLKLLNITSGHRTPYDHYMLNIHDRMKADERYQVEAQQQEVHFPPGSTWIVMTDHVSHAAMQGQYLLEQTFYLPVHAMQNQLCSPLRILENVLNRPLVR